MRGERTALLVVDMLNTYEHDDADQLAASVKKAVPQIADLIERARAGEVAVVYVNDNYGDWNSSSEELAQRAMDGRSTPLKYLLQSMEIGRIVLAGQATEQCILYSALDGYVRHFDVAVPRDGVAHIHEHLAKSALEMMERNMHAEIGAARDLRLG